MAAVEVVCGRDLEANRRQADLDERRRGEIFDVLVQQADEARTRVREGTKCQGMPLLGASPSFVQMIFVRADDLRSCRLG